MSLFRHREIFPNDPGATLSDYARAHRPDESPVGYSSAGCSPASPASALPTGSQCALNSSCWSTDFHRTANCVLTVCLTPGGRPTFRLTRRFRFVLTVHREVIHVSRQAFSTRQIEGVLALGESTGRGE